MVTIYDIAKKTGYTAPSVSKALNGTGGLSQATRLKILKAAEDLGYKPNMAARSLVTKRSNLIGVIFEDAGMLRGFSHPLFAGVLNTFRQEMERKGYDLLFLSQKFGQNAMSYVDHCAYRNVDGVVLINPECPQSDIEDIRKTGIPCISTNDIFPSICTVLSENEMAGIQATEYFISLGHKKIAFLGVFSRDTLSASNERQEGYEKALKEKSIPYDESLIGICNFWHMEAGYRGAKRLLSRRPDITALFIASDTLAFGAMRYCKEVGIAIPYDISIIGFDDDSVSEYYSPPLTTFRQNCELIAKSAANLLLKNIAGESIPEIVRVPVEMIIRESVRQLV